MKDKNIKALEKLSFYCYVCGLFTLFLGVVVVFMNLLERGVAYIQVGLFIFATGYAFVKISTKITTILIDEKKILEDNLPKQPLEGSEIVYKRKNA